MERLVVVVLTPPAAVARVDPAALAVMAATVLLPLIPAVEAVAARVDRRLPLVRQEQFPLAVLAGQGELWALGALEAQQAPKLASASKAAAVAAGLVLYPPITMVVGVIQLC